MPDGQRERSVFLGLLPWPERVRVARALRTETVGGLVLLAAAVVALVWANTPWSGTYEEIRDFHFGLPAIGLDLSVGHWTSDGLLTIFFLVAGIELKRELVVGELRTPATAALPVVAALCGMAVPAGVYLATTGIGGGSGQGWAVPMATDIAFALAVLAVLSTHLPSALRAFLLTLAVVDDLGAILVIALFFTSDLNPAALAGAVAGLVVFYLLQRFRVRGWWWYVPLGVVIWALMYNGGVHATVAGVAMGLILRTVRDEGEDASPGERTEHLLRPVSAGVAVPLFALFAAGVSVSTEGVGEVFTRPEPLGVVLGLVVGKTVGVFAGTYLAARFTRARLNPDLAWADVFALAVLAGIGFTVALLIGELAFTDPADVEYIKAAVLLGSLLAAAVAALLVKRRNGIYRRLWEAETRDDDADGIPDIYQRTASGRDGVEGTS
ncbi:MULTISPECIES: Na+/H+ antiporter NhaA [Streptomyces]|uniref:Na(+)/H(+) antiporter NhaA n=1 Tax=Streptomyces stelliscabiei TaxID=146820 RepID=A0A8I0TM49_9ACTN|nr:MULTISPECIES: Na+/H+ antiporter NhaA [Streptomyces]KFG09902.1 pH-dependent sodium/proton antiporter [Streptomyces scabiei]KND38853.1 pH-dependent sodium/proton antiporter [Streptomyces stelliscabiei]MBE1594170.1 NhaA family Na+:H+ antiporter [Streptomyces stelliscabiei]MDX2520271.1 Na+/H+ antiporter NhaA [Streptomyces stelliscabiei]MDX2836616.1 Na+/H+ antiporter NhaA [Streptomyces scabiei]